MTNLEIQLVFALTGLTLVNALERSTLDWPVMIFQEGKTAHLPCPPQGDAEAIFWRKGEWYNDSKIIAYIVHGISDTSDKYNVLNDGTLLIKDMSRDDEGQYYCRIASETNECYGSLTLFVEVNAKTLNITIEGCNANSTCIKILQPSLPLELTCHANMVSDSMTLKWYNGTKEIPGHVEIYEGEGGKRKIANLVTFVFEDDSQLTCEAEDVRIRRSVAVIQLKREYVSAQTLNITIEGCNASSACIKRLQPSLSLDLTCHANMVSESMTLKWYNGTKEVPGYVEIHEGEGGKMKITNLVMFIFEDDFQLTCEAEDVRIRRSVAVIQLKGEYESTQAGGCETTIVLIIPIISLSILSSILVGVLICSKVYNGKQIPVLLSL